MIDDHTIPSKKPCFDHVVNVSNNLVGQDIARGHMPQQNPDCWLPGGLVSSHVPEKVRATKGGTGQFSLN